MDALFDTDQSAHARRTDPLSSHLAAERASMTLTDTQDRVLIALRIGGPASDEQLVGRFRDWWPDLKISDQSIRSRRSEVVKKGLVEATDNYGTTRYGQRARVWKAVGNT